MFFKFNTEYDIRVCLRRANFAIKNDLFLDTSGCCFHFEPFGNNIFVFNTNKVIYIRSSYLAIDYEAMLFWEIDLKRFRSIWINLLKNI